VNTLTLKIPEELDAALKTASAQRGMSKSAVVREAIEQALGRQLESAATAERWLGQWRGAFVVPESGAASKTPRRSAMSAPAKRSVETDDVRLAHILAKHVR
jgi:predicted transcriptional regulator